MRGRTGLGAAAALLAGCAAPAAPPPEPAESAAFSIEVRIENGAGVTVTAPRIFAMAGQRCNVHVLRQESYIQSFEVAKGVADPVVGSVHAGVLLEGRAATAADGGCTFEYRLQVVDPDKPFREYRYEAAPKSEVTIQMPTVRRVEVEGTARIPDREERLLASLPDPSGKGSFLVRARISRARLAEDGLEGEVISEPVPAPPTPASPSGWFRVRAGTIAGDWKQGDLVEGEALDALLARGAMTVTGDLQWAAAPSTPARASVLEERAYVRDFDFDAEVGQDSFAAFSRPVLDRLSAGLMAEAGEGGAFSCTLSTVKPMQTFDTTLDGGHKVTIDLPEILVRRGRVSAAAGPRLLVLGPRDGGGADAVLVAFRPGATGPED